MRDLALEPGALSNSTNLFLPPAPVPCAGGLMTCPPPPPSLPRTPPRQRPIPRYPPPLFLDLDLLLLDLDLLDLVLDLRRLYLLPELDLLLALDLDLDLALDLSVPGG